MIGAQLCHVGKVRQQRKAMRVGLTGGIASGKTLVAAMLELCGAPVAFADQMARGIMERPGPVRDQLIELLGASIYRSDDSLDREALGAKLFRDDTLLSRVNAIVHPAVAEAASVWHLGQHPEVGYTVYESALIFEAQLTAAFDVVVLVHAPREQRLARAMRRDRADELAVLARMDAQYTDEQRLAQTAYVIMNDGHQLLIPQVLELHRRLVGLSLGSGICYTP